MNRNRKLRKQMMSGLAVGMAAVMGAAPVYAATGEDAAVSKEETVYVNANADGSEDQITVSNWLKNAGTEKNLQDESELKDIKNVKGDEEFTQSGNKLTWQTDGEDIYYQGTTTKEPPVSVKFTYYLDGKEIKPDDLAGKSGKLKIKVDYTNNTKTTVDINGKKETMYTPFVLMTGMILPQDTFSNVKIDNGKVISDGSRNIVIGFGMPGLQESLGLNSDSLEDLVSGDSDFELPESLEITADVENFSLDSTFTVALDDVLDTIDTDNITGYDDLKDALSDLEDAAMELVDGSKALSDGVDTLKDSYKELDDGIGTLKDGADELNSGAGTLAGGAGTLASGASTLANGTSTLNSGKTAEIYNNFVVETVSGIIFSAIVYIVMFVLLLALAGVIGILLNVIEKLPVLKQINKLAGGAAGLVKGLLIVWIAAILVMILSNTPIGIKIAADIDGNVFLRFLYDKNLIMYFLTGGKNI